MYKLMILIEPLPDDDLLDEFWPQFLHHAEKMPGLIKEATVRIHSLMFGPYKVERVHELFFESLRDLELALASPDGQQAGQLLQSMTRGKLTLLIAEHKEDDIENIRRYQKNIEDPERVEDPVKTEEEGKE